MTLKEMIEDNIKYEPFKYFRPKNYDKMEEVFDRMKLEADSTEDTIICGVGDWDVDGVLSLKILTNTLKDIGLKNIDTYFGNQKEHGMTQDFVNTCLQKKYKYVIVVDSSSNSMSLIKYLTKMGVEVIILDHHVCEYNYNDYPEGCVIINSKMEGNEVINEISAGMLTYLATSFYRKHLGIEVRVSDLWFAYVTLISDSCNLNDKYIKPIILGINGVGALPLELELFTNRYAVANRRFYTYNFNSKINNMCRLERIDLIERLFYRDNGREGKIAAIEEIEELHKTCKEGLKELIEVIDVCVEDLGSCTLVNIDKATALTSLPQVYLTNATGLIASRVSSSEGKASIAYMSWDKDNYKLSGRDNYGVFPFQGMLRSLNLEGGGHLAAIGFSIPKIDLDLIREFARMEGIEREKEDSHHILTIEDLEERSLERLFRSVSTYNEISGGRLKPIRIRIPLISGVFSMRDIGKLRLFSLGNIEVKDLMQTKTYGEYVDIEPEYNKFKEALVCYF